jgi:hypothetical protein
MYVRFVRCLTLIKFVDIEDPYWVIKLPNDPAYVHSVRS